MAKLLGHFEKGLWERVTAVTRCAELTLVAIANCNKWGCQAGCAHSDALQWQHALG